MDRRTFITLVGTGVVGFGLPAVATADHRADSAAPRDLWCIQSEGRSLRVPTGIQELDADLGGGWEKGSINLIHGDACSGRSTLLAYTVLAALQSGLRVAVLDYERSQHYWWIALARRNGIKEIERLRAYQGEGFTSRMFSHICTLSDQGWADVVVGDFAGLVLGQRDPGMQENRAQPLLENRAATVVLTARTPQRRTTTFREPLVRVSSVVVRTRNSPESGWVEGVVEKSRHSESGLFFQASTEPIRRVFG